MTIKSIRTGWTGIGLSSSNWLQGYTEAVLADSPVGFWLLDDTSGTMAKDRSTNANDATYYNTPSLDQAGPGGIAKSVFFDGASNEVAYTNLISALNFASNSSWSAECWYKDNSTNNTTIEAIFAVRDDSGSTNQPFVIAINNTVAGRIQAFIANNSGANITLQYDLTPDTNWHQIVITATSGGAVRLYVDSVERASSTTARNSTTGNKRAVMSANWSGSAIQIATANIAACSVYTSALSAARILEHYYKGI